jgi:hypothetical protein
MAIQSFSVGQVLTAAQVNALQANDYNQTVSNKTGSYTLVAADKGTRIAMSSTSATTITVNSSLFSAGDTLFIQNLNSGVCTITAGTATVTTSASLALAQWEGGTLYFTSASAAIFFKSDGAAAASGGMTLIAETVANADASISYSSLGSYKQLFMTWSGLYQGSDTGFSLRLNNDSSGIYQVQQWGADDANVLDEYNNDQTSIGGSIRLPFGKNTPNTKNERSQGSILIDNYTSTTKFKQVYWQTSYKISGSIKVNINARVMYESTSAITSLDIVRFSGAGTLSNSTSTSIRLYGIS